MEMDGSEGIVKKTSHLHQSLWPISAVMAGHIRKFQTNSAFPSYTIDEVFLDDE